VRALALVPLLFLACEVERAAMETVEESVGSWLQTQQDWLQEAALRVLTLSKLDDANVNDVAQLLMSPAGQAKTKSRAFTVTPSPSGGAHDVRLASLGPVAGIDCLDPKTPLLFGKGNLTVVYGNNGSGKSGYTRILKRACGHAKAVDLKSNVFAPEPAVRSCTVSYSVNGKHASVDWSADGQAVSDLKATDIFDTDVSRTYLTGESSAAYSPPVIAFFENLVAVTKEVRNKLQLQQDLLVSKMPKLPVEYSATQIAQHLKGIGYRQTAAGLESLLAWGEGDAAALAQLTERLAQVDPLARARAKRAQNRQIASAIVALRKAVNHLLESKCNEYHRLRVDAVDKRRIATEGLQATTSSAKLTGIGGETWRALWTAAENYSKAQAYPAQQFPFTETGAKCVLCHQDLDEAARSRLSDFRSYVDGVLEQAASTAEAAFQAHLMTLPLVPVERDLETVLEAAGISGSDWAEKLKASWKNVASVIQELKNEKAERAPRGLDASEMDFCEALEAFANTLEGEALIYEADATSFDRVAASKAVLELKAKEWAAQQLDAIKSELIRLQSVEQFERWKKLTTSAATAISKKAGEVSEVVLTETYIGRFNAELNALSASRIKVALTKTRIQSGIPLHQIKLLKPTSAGVAPSQILSEGEYRIVALAAFLADVTGRGGKSPFIFDDPISSLDQDYEWKVALRLVELAKDRQVMVFTHRLSLYGALEDACKKAGDDWRKANLHQICIESFGGSTGHPVPPEAWNTPTKTANNILIQRLDIAKKLSDAGEISTYKTHAQSICTDFRKLLERTVEDDLLNAIVKRHRRSVTTDNKVIKLHKITKDDGEYFDALMTKYSCYEHSQSADTPVSIPLESELRTDLISLKTWRDSFHTRT
jgi:energy-coupling factor transporter ATP-binding protein EcfA2